MSVVNPLALLQLSPSLSESAGLQILLQVQYDLNEGRCGVCGDPWNDNPREHEAGGKYANGIITRSYEIGQVITVVVQITANHLGWMEFRLCVNDDPTKAVTLDCLDQHVLGQSI